MRQKDREVTLSRNVIGWTKVITKALSNDYFRNG
jgi:hypothetical protein